VAGAGGVGYLLLIGLQARCHKREASSAQQVQVGYRVCMCR
jgi:hypothetical protein